MKQEIIKKTQISTDHFIHLFVPEIEAGEIVELVIRKNSDSSKNFDRLLNFIEKNPINLPANYKFNRAELYE